MTPESKTYTFENRVYQNPEASRDEQLSFIDTLRATQQANNAQIRTQTENLGTAVPSQLGGLTGPESYFTARYQTAPTNQVVASLRSAAQASALNTALSNLQDQYQKRYQDAYRNYQKRASSGSGGGGNGSMTTTGEVIEEATDTIAQPDEIMRRIAQAQQEAKNAKKAAEYIEQVQEKTDQALTPPTTVLSPEAAIEYWKNLRR